MSFGSTTYKKTHSKGFNDLGASEKIDSVVFYLAGVFSFCVCATEILLLRAFFFTWGYSNVGDIPKVINVNTSLLRPISLSMATAKNVTQN